MTDRDYLLRVRSALVLAVVVGLVSCTPAVDAVRGRAYFDAGRSPAGSELTYAGVIASPVATDAPSTPAGPTISLAPVSVAASRRFAEELGVAVNAVQTEHFVLVANSDEGRLSQLAPLLEETHRAFFDVFADQVSTPAHAPRERFVWIVFDAREPFEQYARRADRMNMSWAEAYYSARTNRVAIALAAAGSSQDLGAVDGSGALAIKSGQTVRHGLPRAQVTHEAAHQLAFNSGVQKRGVMYPLWASEGLAANFEMDDAGQVGPGASNPLRRQHVAAARRDALLLSLPRWVGLTHVPIGRPRQVNAVYGQSWAFFRFLHTHHRAALTRYLAAMAQREPGRRSQAELHDEFAAAFGDPEALEPQWLQYVEDLTQAGAAP